MVSRLWHGGSAGRARELRAVYTHAARCCAALVKTRSVLPAQRSYYLSRSYASSSKAQRSNAHRTCERSFMIKSLQVARYDIYYGRMNSLVRVEMLFFLLLAL